MTFTQGHICAIDYQKFACVHDKVRSTHRITTKSGSFIAQVMVITQIDFVVVLMETVILANFLLKFWMCLFEVKH